MSETDDITTLVKAAAMAPSILTDAWGRQHAFIPNGDERFRMENITPIGAILPETTYIRQSATIDHAQSLIDYLERFKTDDTVIFLDLKTLSAVAAIDYHKEHSIEAGLVSHNATLKLAYSQEWATWSGISGRMYDQKSFARMLDVNSDDISNPTAAALLEAVMDLEMATSVTVMRKLATTGSSRGSQGVERVTSGTVLPAFFTLSIPVFAGEPKVEVRALTKDAIDGNSGKISLGLELVRPMILVESELARIARDLASKTSVPVIMGSLG